MDELIREVDRPQRGQQQPYLPGKLPGSEPSSAPGSRSPHATWSPTTHGFSSALLHGGTEIPGSAACSARLTAISSGQRGETPDQSVFRHHRWRTGQPWPGQLGS